MLQSLLGQILRLPLRVLYINIIQNKKKKKKPNKFGFSNGAKMRQIFKSFFWMSFFFEHRKTKPDAFPSR